MVANVNEFLTQELEKENTRLRYSNAELAAENVSLKARIDELESKLAHIRKKPGRKKMNADWLNRYEQVGKCIEAGMSPQETADALSIGKATYFRYSKIYKNQKRNNIDSFDL